MKEIKETCEICGYELSEAQNNKHNHEDTDSLMTNYEKTKKEGIEEFRNKFPQTKIVVMVEGDAEEIFLADMLEELASSFAEKIKEAVERDFTEKIDEITWNYDDVGVNELEKNTAYIKVAEVKAFLSDSQTIKEPLPKGE